MGCGASSQRVAVDPENKPSLPPPHAVKAGLPDGKSPTSANHNASKTAISMVIPYQKKILNGKSSLIRLDTSGDLRRLPVTGKAYSMVLQYCYVSQRGYYPTSLGKANQDSYLVCESVLGDSSCNFFGIFDGHGEFGDLCSHYAAEFLCDNLVNEISALGGLDCLDGPKMTDIVSKAHLVTNLGMEKSSIDDSLSGTTSITILQKGDKLIVSNVGDSRAIIASEKEGKLQFSPLSSDQTPYRKDERERLKKSGATIMTMDQIEGNEPIHENYCTDLGQEIDEGGDPPRVWDKTLERPGCAFSRSFGDRVAKEVGVSAEPEILEWNITPEDRFAVIASDGVFEFITSQAVVNMIQKYPNKLEAAKQVVAEAYRLWLTFDDRTDDITIIIITFENVKEQQVPSKMKKPELSRGMSRALSSDNLLRNSRPVRKVMSRAKRKDIAENWSKEEMAQIDFDKLPNTKTEEDIARLSNMLGKSFMFESLSPIQKDHIFKVMEGKDVKAGDVVIKEGDQGDDMYIVDRGQFLVYKKDEQGIDQQIFAYSEEGAAFGELSLMYGKPRAASVVAKTDGKLWSLGRAAFRAVMMRGKAEGLLEIYQTIPVLADQSIPALHRLCLSSKELHFEKGVLKLVPKDSSKKRQLRAELAYFSMAEIGTVFQSAIAESNLRISCISREIWMETVGLEGDATMKTELAKSKSKGVRLKPILSPFAMEDNIRLEKMDIENFRLDHPITFIADYGFFACFDDDLADRSCTMKVYSKSKVHHHRMEKGILTDRNILAVLNKTDKVPDRVGFPIIMSTFVNEKWAYVAIRDHFVSDLGMAISSQALSEESKPYHMACLYSALSKIHDLGLIHRFININSCFITNSGTLKLTDFRFAKRMDGAYCFTICGDPLYFAPELVIQQGYDYAADLWAFGITLYELHEGCSPFGNNETEETKIFRAISSFSGASNLKFNKSSEKARDLILRLLKFSPEQRCGYKDPQQMKRSSYFEGIDWSNLSKHTGYPIDIQPSIELRGIMDDNSAQPFSSSMFDKF
eukprot:scaffold911_cov162-Ochromonas_danica.AAC.9